MDKIKDFIKKMNESGVPLPLIRLDGKPTFTGTLTFISFNTALLSQFGKFVDLFKTIDTTQANYLFLICLGSYLGRRFQGNGKTVTISSDKEEKTGEKDA